MKTNTEHSTNQKAINELAIILKSFNYDVYIAESGTYGFFCNPDGQKLISFHVSIWWITFSSNYKGQNIGTGHQISNNEKNSIWNVSEWATKKLFDSLLNCTPYHSRRKNEKFIRWTNLEEHLDFYGSSSRYVKK